MDIDLLKKAFELGTNMDQATTGINPVDPVTSARMPDGHSETVNREARKERIELLERLFDDVPKMRKTETELLHRNFGVRGFSSHSPLLESGATLIEDVRKVLGRP